VLRSPSLFGLSLTRSWGKIPCPTRFGLHLAWRKVLRAARRNLLSAWGGFGPARRRGRFSFALRSSRKNEDGSYSGYRENADHGCAPFCLFKRARTRERIPRKAARMWGHSFTLSVALFQ
jgi:hypothetical protein